MKNADRQTLRLSALKGITVYAPDDLHDVAKLQLKLSDARATHDGSTSISRPTVNGLAKLFAEFINVCRPDYDHVFKAIADEGLALGATIEFD
jgi:hypothetical protein